MYARIFTANCDNETRSQHQHKIKKVLNEHSVRTKVWFPHLVRIHKNEHDDSVDRDIRYAPFKHYEKDDGEFYTTEFYEQSGKNQECGCEFLIEFDTWEEYHEMLKIIGKARTSCGCNILFGDYCIMEDPIVYDEQCNRVEIPPLEETN